MATVTLYDAATGTPVAGAGTVPPDPVVSADDHAGVSFALDPRRGRGIVQFLVEPGSRRLVAAFDLEEGDGLPDVNRAILERLDATDVGLAPPGGAPPHLNTFHHLAAPDRVWPDADRRARLVATDEPVAVDAPSAAAAVAVVSFFRERAPWKVVVVKAPGTTVSSDDADVAVRVDRDVDDVTYRGRDVERNGGTQQPGSSPAGSDAGGSASTVTTEDPAGASASTGGGASTDSGPAAATGSATGDRESAGSGDGLSAGDDHAGDPSRVLRVYDGQSGRLAYDSRRAGEVPEATSEDAKRLHREGVSLFVDPAEGVLRALLDARGAGLETPFVVEYEHDDVDEPLLASFARDIAGRVDDLGVEFVVDVCGEAVDCDRLTNVDPRRPDALGDHDVAWLRRRDRPLTFATPPGTVAVEVAAFFRRVLDDDSSVAVCAAGRTAALAGMDVVVVPESDRDSVEPRGETTTALADRRLQDRLSDLRTSVAQVVERVDEVTGTVPARQRVFAAALSGGTVARRGYTVVPVDDSPLARRRRQVRSLVLYGLLVAGLAVGVHTEQFAPLAALLTDTYRITLDPVAGTPLAAIHLAAVVDGTLVDGELIAGSCLAVLLAGAYWLGAYPLGPVAAGRALAATVRRQVTGGAGSGTVPTSVRTVADDVQSSFDTLATVYDRLADEPGTMAARADDFGAFLEARVLAGPGVPDVELVSRTTRWRQLVVSVTAGTLVGATSGIAILGAGWLAIDAAHSVPATVLNALVVVVALVVLVSVMKGVAVLLARSRPPRLSATR